MFGKKMYDQFRNIVRRIEVVPASRLAGLDVRLDSVNSAASTPLPYPKSKSTSSLEDALPPSSSLSTTSSSSSLLLASYSGGGGTGTPTGGTAGPCGGFSTQYAWMCDLLGLPYRDEVAWVSVLISELVFVSDIAFPIYGTTYKKIRKNSNYTIEVDFET